MTTSRKLRGAALATMMTILSAVVALGGCSRGTRTHVYTTPEPYPPPVVVAPTAQAQPVLSQPLLSSQQLDELLAPIALYPDSLLAEVLPASTYPAEVGQAWQWLQANPAAGDAAIEGLNLEPSVKAVAHYPEVLQMLAEHADWTQAIGAAFLTQQDDVLMSIQRLRTMAVEAQTLRSTPQQQVIVADNYVEILPASPEVIYVPVYDPVIVYVRRPQPAPIIFSVRFTSGRWLGNCLDWHGRRVAVGAGWHPQWRYEENQWRPADRDVVFTRGPTISRATRPAVVAARPTAQQWSHNPAKGQPRLPAAQMVRRPGPPGQRVEPMVDIRPTRPAGDQRRPAPNQTTPPRSTPPEVVTPKPAAPPTPRLPVAKPTTPPTPTPERRPIPKPTTPPEVVTPKPITPPTPPATRPTPERRPIPKPTTPPEVVTPKPITPPTPPATRPTPEPRPIPKPTTPPEVVTPKPITPPTPPATRPTRTPAESTRKGGPDSNSAKS